jgi:hypothetical protein
MAAWIWGWRNPPPIVADEGAYLLQARIFAGFRWTAPARPWPGFFEQMQVFTTPVLASKYPPGHSILLVPGIWLHWPVLVPLLLTGAAAAVFFLLARRIAGTPTALLAWAIWVTSLGFRVFADVPSGDDSLPLAGRVDGPRSGFGQEGWLVWFRSASRCVRSHPSIPAIALAVPAASSCCVRYGGGPSSLSSAAVAGAAARSFRSEIGGLWELAGDALLSSRTFFPHNPGTGGSFDLRASLPPGYASFDREYRTIPAAHMVTLPGWPGATTSRS